MLVIAVPTYNNAKTIAATIHSLLESSKGLDRKIVVCANGCTDKTATIVQQTFGTHPDVELIELPRANKNAAINEVVTRNRNAEHFVFADGDITVSKNAVTELIDALKSGKRFVGAHNRAHPAKGIVKWATKNAPHNTLPTGRLMAIRGADMPALPLTHAHDDAYLNSYIAHRFGMNAIGLVKTAKVFFHHPSVGHFWRRTIKGAASDREIKREFGRNIILESKIKRSGTRTRLKVAGAIPKTIGKFFRR